MCDVCIRSSQALQREKAILGILPNKELPKGSFSVSPLPFLTKRQNLPTGIISKFYLSNLWLAIPNCKTLKIFVSRKVHQNIVLQNFEELKYCLR